jgi:hypothetical protein
MIVSRKPPKDSTTPAKGTTRRIRIESCGHNENQPDVQKAIQKHVVRGTTVATDCGGAFIGAAECIGGIQETVNHSEGFCIGGVHTNDAEGRNGLFKYFLKRLGNTYALNDDVLWDYISHYIFEQWFSNGTHAMMFGMFVMAMYNEHGFVF